ncbi:MAG TPA: TetR/AcrR family transcriptional regulator [Propionibacterium sp.]|jgi:AcrR family transcriptional regulator|nr:TetR/AcrR family transcriptional regulator [Propionibacterium sp.]
MARAQDPDTRERILTAARSIARTRGYKGTTLAMIQKAAGVHPGSFYWFFKDKDELFAALVRHAHAEATKVATGVALTDHPNPVGEALGRIVNNPARFGLWRFNVQLMLDPDMRTSKTADAIRGLRDLTKEAMVEQWLQGLDPVVVAQFPDLPRQLSEYSLATVEGCVLSRIANQPLDDEFITRVSTTLMDTWVVDACRTAGVSVPDGVARRIKHRETSKPEARTPRAELSGESGVPSRAGSTAK